MAHESFIKALTNRNIVCEIASEESEDFIKVNSTSNKKNNYVVLIDPFDGSSNIDNNYRISDFDLSCNMFVFYFKIH